jgi:hypothetical protein
MAPADDHSRRFQSWPASITLFAIASAGEFVGLVGWYLFHTPHPALWQKVRASLLGVDWGWLQTLVMRIDWTWFDARHWLVASLVLVGGFVIERYVVVLWLNVPPKVITPSGNLRSLWLVLVGVTVAEMATWTIWLELAEAREPWFGAAVLAVGIHLVHSYEVALLKQTDLRATLIDPGVIGITVLESAGGVAALWLAARGGIWLPLGVMSGALVMEHIAQVIGLKKGAESSMPLTVAHATRH